MDKREIGHRGRDRHWMIKEIETRENDFMFNKNSRKLKIAEITEEIKERKDEELELKNRKVK